MAFRIQDLPTSDRPRERLLTRGVNALADRELLALNPRYRIAQNNLKLIQEARTSRTAKRPAEK